MVTQHAGNPAAGFSCGSTVEDLPVAHQPVHEAAEHTRQAGRDGRRFSSPRHTKTTSNTSKPVLLRSFVFFMFPCFHFFFFVFFSLFTWNVFSVFSCSVFCHSSLFLVLFFEWFSLFLLSAVLPFLCYVIVVFVAFFLLCFPACKTVCFSCVCVFLFLPSYPGSVCSL